MQYICPEECKYKIKVQIPEMIETAAFLKLYIGRDETGTFPC